MWGSGQARREFTYVGDLASWIAANLERIGELPGLLNLGIGKDYSIDEFYLAAMNVIDYQVPLVHNRSKPEGMQARLMDSSMARNSYGWEPSIDLIEGLNRTYSWFLKTKDKNARV